MAEPQGGDRPPGSVKLALAGDAMLARRVGEVLGSRPPHEIVGPEVREAIADADQFLLNLECPISERGVHEAPADPDNRFAFCAPPDAADFLAEIGVDCVSLANNHALDFGPAALADTFDYLRAAGIRWVGAGSDQAEAWAPQQLEHNGIQVAVVAVADGEPSPPGQPGIACTNLTKGRVSTGLEHLVGQVATEVDAVLVTPHWGPTVQMSPETQEYQRLFAQGLLDQGATFIAGHSAHLVHGVDGRILYDMGDFINDYAAHISLRNDLGLLFLLTLDRQGPVELEALPLHITFRSTNLATGQHASWILRRFRKACRVFGTTAQQRDGRVVITWPR